MISIVTPVYRSAESLPELYRRLTEVFGDSPQALEILFVEDCGGDDSWEVIQRLAATDPRVRGFRTSRASSANPATRLASWCSIQ